MNLLVRHVLCALMPATETMPGMKDADVDAFLVRFRKESAPLLWTATGAFVVAWIAQFIGHEFEGKRPSFLTDLTYLLIGPLWLMSKLFRKFGLRW